MEGRKQKIESGEKEYFQKTHHEATERQLLSSNTLDRNAGNWDGSNPLTSLGMISAI